MKRIRGCILCICTQKIKIIIIISSESCHIWGMIRTLKYTTQSIVVIVIAIQPKPIVVHA